MYPVLKRTDGRLEIPTFLFECFIFEYISFSTVPALNRYDYMGFPVRLWLTYGSLK